MKTDMVKYVFEDVDILVNFLFKINENNSLSPLKLQKALYFLYAYYLGFYSKIDKDNGISEYNDNLKSNISAAFPDELFPAEFEAWSYGPVIKKVYLKKIKVIII